MLEASLSALVREESQLSRENKELPPTHRSDCAPEHTTHLPSAHLTYSHSLAQDHLRPPSSLSPTSASPH